MLYSNDDEVMPYICYDVKILTGALTPYIYSDYQTELYGKVKKLRDKNLTFKEIANKLNEHGQISTRGKILKANHVFSILKKWKIRDSRINQPAIITIENFSIRYIVI